MGFAEAIVIVKTILGEPVTPIDYEKVPWVMYSQPEVAWCGLTEEEAIERGHDVVVSTHRFAGEARAMIIGETEGLVKIVADTDGLAPRCAHRGPVGDGAARRGVPARELGSERGRHRRADAPHPTLSEVFGEAALSAHRPSAPLTR